jgi:tRNA(Ile)-lysidine synthase
MLLGGERVLVAVSGGPDSVALADVLAELAPALRIALEVAHVDHDLRAGAGRDADLVRDLCGRLGLACHVERVAVRRGPPWDGLEAEARRARHAALRARAAAIGAHRIATGHTADDQAETVLMRLLQGSGPRGLAGMAPVRGLLVRPLLEARRADVVAHVAARRLPFVEDESNRDLRFLRNRIRHEVLPSLAALAGPDLPGRLCGAARACRAWVEDLERRAEAELDRLGVPGAAGIVLPATALAALSPPVGLEVLLAAARRLGVGGPARGPVHRALARALRLPPSRRPARVGSLVVERSGRWLRVGPRALDPVLTRPLAVPGSIALAEVGARLEARCFERHPGYAPPADARRVAFDADRLPDPLLVRARRRGDRFHPFGGPGARRLKAFLVDAAVPRWERSRVPIVDAGGEIIWVAGVRRGQAAPVTPASRRILEVTLSPL